MKKVLSTLAILGTATAVFAQGVLSFNASTFPIGHTNSALSSLFGGSGTGGSEAVTPTTGSYYYALLLTAQTAWQTAPTDTSVWDSTWVNSGILSSNSTTTAGRLVNLGNSINVGSVLNNLGQAWNGNNTGTGGPSGVTNGIVLVGWSANLGTTWAGVASILNSLSQGNSAPLFAQIGAGNNAFFGESAFGWLMPAAQTPGQAIFGSSATIGANGLPITAPAGSPLELYSIVPEPSTMALAGLGGLSLLLFRRRK